jgi:phospholipase C
MTKKIVDHLAANKELFAETALIVTFDEGGGFLAPAIFNRWISSAMGSEFR